MGSRGSSLTLRSRLSTDNDYPPVYDDYMSGMDALIRELAESGLVDVEPSSFDPIKDDHRDRPERFASLEYIRGAPRPGDTIGPIISIRGGILSTPLTSPLTEAEKIAMDHYVQNMPYINAYLRGTANASKLRAPGGRKAHIANMDSAIAKAKPLPRAVTVYRGGIPADVLGSLKVGQTFTDKGYI